MTYGKKWASSPEEAQYEVLIEIANLLEKMDKKLFVVIKKLESEEGNDNGFYDRKVRAKQVLDAYKPDIPQLEGDV